MNNPGFIRIIFFTLKIVLVYVLYLVLNVYIDGNPFSFLAYPWDAPIASSIFVGFIISIIINVAKSKKQKNNYY
ncbi:MAG: hypothetical protein A2X18_05065 [Bacteroidetes bacterium GWF2_40_14]|nr:MAG: hypothetical protein A2X18_05065 [Bacteroidetes bacterium GWF2_40_14]